jgi:rod shape determining protein RodA
MSRSGANDNIYQHIDWVMIVCFILLAVFGWMNVLASCNPEDGINLADFSQKYTKQLIWVLSSFVIAILILFVISPKIYSPLSWAFYAVVLGLLAVTIFIGNEINGSKSWLMIGPFSFQPAEISKIATSLVLATFISRPEFDLKKFGNAVIVALLILVPMGLILLENETGSMLVYCGFFLMLYREGMPGWVLLIAFAAAALFVLTLVTSTKIMAIAFTSIMAVAFIVDIIRQKRNRRMPSRGKLILLYLIGLAAGIALIFGTEFFFNDVLQEHQKARIEQLLGMRNDIMGVGYNVHQSEIAIGSGGLFGKGFLQGTQTKYDFVPEQSTDFIFCTVGEEWGFAGTLFVLVLYAILTIRIYNKAEGSGDAFTRIYGYCAASLILMHVVINIGMTIGLIPVIGIPLPFISYGGSSLWSFTILLFIFIRLDLDQWRSFSGMSYVTTGGR